MSINIAEKIIGFLTVIIISTSCSIKENRDVCPCTLTIDFSKCSNGQIVELIGFSGDNSFKRTVQTSTGNNKVKQNVTKGIVHLCAYAGVAEMDLDNYRLIIPPGSQCDSIYMCSYDIECRKEEAVDTILLHKQFADITIGFVDSVDDTFPFQIVVKGKVSGIDTRTLTPIPGIFEYVPSAEGEYGRVFKFRVPRQYGTSLSIDILKEEKVLSSINIGEEISSMGFDWKKTDLDDISISIDYSHNEMNVKIIDWVPTNDKNVII